METQLPTKRGSAAPNFSAHVYCGQSVAYPATAEHCGQTVGWIKMKLGTQVGLGSGHIGHIELDVDPAATTQRGIVPNFRPMSVVVKWLDGLRCHLVWR